MNLRSPCLMPSSVFHSSVCKRIPFLANTLVANYYDKELAVKLKKYGVELVEAPMKHRHFWDCGIHCATVDLVRDGEQQDYFPGRKSGQHFGRIWGDNETRR